MQATFTMFTDPAHKLIRICMGGFYGLGDVEAFEATLRTKVSELGCLPNEHLTLCNVKDMKIQSQEIVAAFTRLMGGDRVRSRRLAFVTGSTLARLQTQRLTDRDGVAYFKDVREAERWLLNADDPVIGAVEAMSTGYAASHPPRVG